MTTLQNQVKAHKTLKFRCKGRDLFMRKGKIITGIVLVGLIGSGTFVYLNNKKINIQEQINLVLNGKKSNPSKKTTTETKTTDDDKDTHPAKTIDGDFESKELATL